MMIYKVADDITWKDLKSGVVILHINSGDYFTLNETASQIWYGIVAGKEDTEIIRMIMDTFDVSEAEIVKDMKDTIDLLKSENVINK
jgi:hypothetical protein